MDTPDLSLMRMIQQGWLATYPLILFSIASLTVIAERLWAFRHVVGHTADLTRALHGDVMRADLAAATDRANTERTQPAGRIFSELLRQGPDASPEVLDQVSAERRFEEIEHLKRPLWILGTVASSAPFIGLFGTVVGIIRAFHSMAVMGSGGFAVVAGGISEALVATALGLGVAIVALVFYNYFQVRLDRCEAAFTIGGARLVEALRADRVTAPIVESGERVAGAVR